MFQGRPKATKRVSYFSGRETCLKMWNRIMRHQVQKGGIIFRGVIPRDEILFDLISRLLFSMKRFAENIEKENIIGHEPAVPL